MTGVVVEGAGEADAVLSAPFAGPVGSPPSTFGAATGVTEELASGLF